MSADTIDKVEDFARKLDLSDRDLRVATEIAEPLFQTLSDIVRPLHMARKVDDGISVIQAALAITLKATVEVRQKQAEATPR